MSMSPLNTSVEVKKLEESIDSLLVLDRNPAPGTTLFAKISILKERLAQAKDGVGFSAGYTHVSEREQDTFNIDLLRDRLNVIIKPLNEYDDMLNVCLASHSFNAVPQRHNFVMMIHSCFAAYIIKNDLFSFKDTQDAWAKFDAYASNEAIERMIEWQTKKFKSVKLRTIKPTKKHVGYSVYESTDHGTGQSRIYNNGVMTQHRNKNVDITFCATFMSVQDSINQA
jgi:hypothetical protein